MSDVVETRKKIAVYLIVSGLLLQILYFSKRSSKDPFSTKNNNLLYAQMGLGGLQILSGAIVFRKRDELSWEHFLPSVGATTIGLIVIGALRWTMLDKLPEDSKDTMNLSEQRGMNYGTLAIGTVNVLMLGLLYQLSSAAPPAEQGSSPPPAEQGMGAAVPVDQGSLSAAQSYVDPGKQEASQSQRPVVPTSLTPPPSVVAAGPAVSTDSPSSSPFVPLPSNKVPLPVSSSSTATGEEQTSPFNSRIYPQVTSGLTFSTTPGNDDQVAIQPSVKVVSPSVLQEAPQGVPQEALQGVPQVVPQGVPQGVPQSLSPSLAQQTGLRQRIVPTQQSAPQQSAPPQSAPPQTVLIPSGASELMLPVSDSRPAPPAVITPVGSEQYVMVPRSVVLASMLTNKMKKN